MNLPPGNGASAPHPLRGSHRSGEPKPAGAGQRDAFSRPIASEGMPDNAFAAEARIGIAVSGSEDARRARAFAGKRPPRFRGR